MRVIFDENLSPPLARALSALFEGEHEIVHIRQKFGPRVTDTEWIARLSAEGRWIVISGDSKITKRKAEQAAFRNSRLIGFFLAPALNSAKVTKQMQRPACSLGRHREHREAGSGRSDVRIADIWQNTAIEVMKRKSLCAISMEAMAQPELTGAAFPESCPCAVGGRWTADFGRDSFPLFRSGEGRGEELYG